MQKELERERWESGDGGWAKRRGRGGELERGEAFIFSDVAVFSSADAMPVDLASAVFVLTCCAFHTL